MTGEPGDEAEPAADRGVDGDGPGAEGTDEEGRTFWADPGHDDTGLDLARSLAKSMGVAAQNAPRAKPRKRRPRTDGPRRRGRGSGAHPDDRDPQLLDTTLGRLVSDQGWAMDLKVHGVFGRWPAIVGEEVAQHCSPTSYSDGKLVVRTDSTAWATQLRLLAPTVVRRLNEELGHGSVTVIEVEGPNLPTWKKGRFGTRDGRGPRDTYG